MAGYVITLDSIESLVRCVETGIYSTKMTQPDGVWRMNHEGTFADLKEARNCVAKSFEIKVY